MLSAETVRPQDLTAKDRAAWAALRLSAEAFSTPLLSPDFADLVAEVRADAAVAVIRKDGRAIGFLPHHRRPHGLARPLGAPFSDYHGLIAEPGLDGLTAMKLAGLKQFRFSALIDPHGAFPRAESQTTAYAIALGEGEHAGSEHLEKVRAASAKRFKNIRRLDHKLEREVGPVELITPDHDAGVYRQMFAWKRAQFLRTGLTDVFAAPWAAALMARVFAQKDGRLRGLMITLHVAGRPAVMHFGVREGDRYHPWVASQDETLAAYSPGQTFLWRVVEAMPSMGLRWYDLAAGHDHYKTPFASHTQIIEAGSLDAAPGFEADAWRLAQTVFGGRGLSRVRRRLDQIAAVELTFEGRVRGVAQALAMHTRRNATRPQITAER